MKKFYKISGLALIIGLIMLFIGVVNNGIHSVIDNHDHFTFTVIDQNEITRNLVTSNKFKKIYISTDSSDVYLHMGSQYKITVTGVNPNAIKAKVANNRLNIDEPQPCMINWKNRNIGSRVDITIPKSNNYTEFIVTSNLGNITLENLKAQDISVDNSVGKVEANNINAKSTHFVVYGNNINLANSQLGKADFYIKNACLKINQSQLTASATAKSSDIEITNSKLINKNMFELIIDGDFYIKNSPNVGYQLTADYKTIKFKKSRPCKKIKKMTSKNNLLVVDNPGGNITVE